MNSLMNWSNQWQLNFNVSKCSVLHIGKNNPCITYHINEHGSQELSKKEFEKDIGVIFDKDCQEKLYVYEYTHVYFIVQIFN